MAALDEATQQLHQYQEACSDLESELHNSRKQASLLYVYYTIQSNIVCGKLMEGEREWVTVYLFYMYWYYA